MNHAGVNTQKLTTKLADFEPLPTRDSQLCNVDPNAHTVQRCIARIALLGLGVIVPTGAVALALVADHGTIVTQRKNLRIATTLRPAEAHISMLEGSAEPVVAALDILVV
eukprot:COSAG02_NODE_32299_length_518_cov_1.439141_1_plen_110_part_00